MVKVYSSLFAAVGGARSGSVLAAHSKNQWAIAEDGRPGHLGVSLWPAKCNYLVQEGTLSIPRTDQAYFFQQRRCGVAQRPLRPAKLIRSEALVASGYAQAAQHSRTPDDPVGFLRVSCNFHGCTALHCAGRAHQHSAGRAAADSHHPCCYAVLGL